MVVASLLSLLLLMRSRLRDDEAFMASENL